MLEQRRAQKKGYITLKEAADFAGYTPDYVGQLIRAGKIKGEQVYSGTAWMTTKEEVESYILDKNRKTKNSKRTTLDGFAALLSLKSQRYLTLLFVVLFGSAILLMQYAIYLSLSGQNQYGSESRDWEVALSETN